LATNGREPHRRGYMPNAGRGAMNVALKAMLAHRLKARATA
jgi:hypothetical protein